MKWLLILLLVPLVYAQPLNATGGSVSGVDVAADVQIWGGFYGSTSGSTSQLQVNGTSTGVSQADLLYSCTHDVVYFAPSSFSWSNLLPAVASDIDTFMGPSSTALQASSIFTDVETFTVNSQSYGLVAVDIGGWHTGILKDGTTPVFAVQIASGFGFDGSSIDYQTMLPSPYGTITTYTLYSDPSCQSSSSSSGSSGSGSPTPSRDRELSSGGSLFQGSLIEREPDNPTRIRPIDTAVSEVQDAIYDVVVAIDDIPTDTDLYSPEDIVAYKLQIKKIIEKINAYYVNETLDDQTLQELLDEIEIIYAQIPAAVIEVDSFTFEGDALLLERLSDPLISSIIAERLYTAEQKLDVLTRYDRADDVEVQIGVENYIVRFVDDSTTVQTIVRPVILTNMRQQNAQISFFIPTSVGQRDNMTIKPNDYTVFGNQHIVYKRDITQPEEFVLITPTFEAPLVEQMQFLVVVPSRIQIETQAPQTWTPFWITLRALLVVIVVFAVGWIFFSSRTTRK